MTETERIRHAQRIENGTYRQCGMVLNELLDTLVTAWNANELAVPNHNVANALGRLIARANRVLDGME